MPGAGENVKVDRSESGVYGIQVQGSEAEVVRAWAERPLLPREVSRGPDSK